MEPQNDISFPQVKDLRVLICDDDETIVYYVKALLEKHGCQVCGTAATGVESIQQFAALRPRVVLLDITMPLGKGLTILPVLQEIDDTAAIIMLTADNRSESVQTSISLGAKGYITKQGLTPETLLFSICKAIGKPVPKPAPSGRGDDLEKSEPPRAHAGELEPQPDVDASVEPARADEKEDLFQGEAESQDENAIVLADALPSIARVYLTGSFHIGNRGHLHLYHPLTARREEGDARIFAREVLQHPDYFFSFLLKTQGFQEIPALLYDQGLDGRIYELLIKPILKNLNSQGLAFAIRPHEPAKHESLPVGLHVNGDIYTFDDRNPSEADASGVREYLLNEELLNAELPHYKCSFDSLSLEISLFLSVFNRAAIVEGVQSEASVEASIDAHITETQHYSRWQRIPKAILFGSFGLLPLPKSSEDHLVVTNALGSTETTSEERSQIYYWMEMHQYRSHLLHFYNRWSLNVMPLLQLPGLGTFSILTSFGIKNQFGVVSSTNPADIFSRKRYKTIAIKDLLREFPQIKLHDLLRPLLLNAFVSRYPSVRLGKNMQSTRDIQGKREFFRELIHGGGVEWIQNDHYYLYKKACQSLQQRNINESNPNYTKELVQEITDRVHTMRNLPVKPVLPKPVSERELVQRVREREKPILEDRYRKKYEDI